MENKSTVAETLSKIIYAKLHNKIHRQFQGKCRCRHQIFYELQLMGYFSSLKFPEPRMQWTGK